MMLEKIIATAKTECLSEICRSQLESIGLSHRILLFNNLEKPVSTQR